MAESLFEPFDSNRHYGGYWPSGMTEYAYRAVNVDRAIRTDDLPRLKEAVANGWIVKSSRCFDESTVIDYCDHRRAAKCAAWLRDEGWPERKTA